MFTHVYALHVIRTCPRRYIYVNENIQRILKTNWKWRKKFKIKIIRYSKLPYDQ